MFIFWTHRRIRGRLYAGELWESSRRASTLPLEVGAKSHFGHVLYATAPGRGNGCSPPNHSPGGEEKSRFADSMDKGACRQLRPVKDGSVMKPASVNGSGPEKTQAAVPIPPCGPGGNAAEKVLWGKDEAVGRLGGDEELFWE